MNKAFLFLLIFITFSCKKNETESISLDTSIDISYVNSNGEDLLSIETPNHYKESEIEIYYLVNGTKVKIYDEALSNPKSFFISKEKREGLFFLRLFPYTSYNHENGIDENNHSVTYIRFMGEVEDKIECEYRLSNDKMNIECIKVWFNDDLVWEKANGERRFTINR